jgi:hypothetical protein
MDPRAPPGFFVVFREVDGADDGRVESVEPDLVLGFQRRDERVRRPARVFELRRHGLGDVEHEDRGEGRVRRLEGLDELRLAVFEDREIFGGEAVHRVALLVRHDRRQTHRVRRRRRHEPDVPRADVGPRDLAAASDEAGRDVVAPNGFAGRPGNDPRRRARGSNLPAVDENIDLVSGQGAFDGRFDLRLTRG